MSRSCLYHPGNKFRPGLIVLLAMATSAWAQRAPTTAKANPQAPTLNMPAPMGMQRGTSLDLALTGSNLAEPTGLWTSFPAKVAIPTDGNNGHENDRLSIHLEVPPDAPLGFHAIRLATTRGLSNLRLFCIDDLPQIVGTGSNRSRATAQAVPVPSVVVGRIDAEASEYFKITAHDGQRISFDVLGRRLGSALDPQLTLYHAGSGRELPGGHSNDAPGLQSDPRLTYTFSEAGDYVIEVRDTTYKGGADYWYRLRIGDFPCATAAVPLAARRGSKVSVHFAGPMVVGVEPVEVSVPSDPLTDTVWVAPRGANRLYGWPVALAVSDLDEAVEQEPNNEPARANRIAVPGAITGRFEEKDDKDCFVFAASKGQKLVIEAQTLEFCTPTLVYMSLKDAGGKELAKINPQAAPPADQRIEFTPQADGDYFLEVEHLNYSSGPSEVYRLTVTPLQPSYDLFLSLDRYDLPQGASVTVTPQVVRRDYAGPIELSVVGQAGLTGQATIPAGQQSAALTIRADPDLQTGPYVIAIEGKATINGHEVVTHVSVRAPVSDSLAKLPCPPRQLLNKVGLAVTEKNR